MTDELASQEVEVAKAIEKWKEKLDKSDVEKSQLDTELKEAKSEIVELKNLCNKFSDDDRTSQLEERTMELSESIALLEDQLKEQEQEALDAVEQWQSACSDLERKSANLELVIKDNRETIAARGWSIEQLTSCNESYCSQIEKLKAISSTVESSLREDLASAEAETDRLKEALKIERKKQVDDQEQFQAKLRAEKEIYEETREQIETLSSSLKSIDIDSRDTLNQWTGMYLIRVFAQYSLNPLYLFIFFSVFERDKCDTKNYRLP
jgi:DNA repair exonuclease SbcCD ATPase subunit